MRFFYFDPTVSTPTGKLSQLAGIEKYIPCFQKRCNLKNIEIYTPFVLRKQKVHIFHVYFQIATLKGTCVCIHIYTYMCIYIYIYIYTTSWRRVHFYQNGFSSVMILVFSFPPCSIISEILRRSSVLIIVGVQ